MGKTGEVRVIAENRRARHDYEIVETLEAGMVLTGTEIKSLREGKVSLQEARAVVEKGEVYLHHLHIAPYSHGGPYNPDPLRPRKLLLHRREIAHLSGAVRVRGYTLIPLRIYLRGGWAKVELALARGKKKYDKRRAIAEREAARRIARALRARR